MAYKTLSLDVTEGIAHVQFIRGAEFNTMNRAFWPEMVAVFGEIEQDPSARVVVFSAHGKHFTSGLDLNDFAVACIGGGIDLISACDIRYCAEDAFFSIQETNIGMTADVGTLQRLPHMLPQGIVRELTYTGRRMMAAEAREWGLVNQVFTDHAALLDGVMAIAGEIATKSPIATVGNKEMLNYARDHSIADGLNYVATWNAAMLSRADLGEAFMAKQQKRDASYADLDPTRKLV